MRPSTTQTLFFGAGTQIAVSNSTTMHSDSGAAAGDHSSGLAKFDSDGGHAMRVSNETMHGAAVLVGN